MMCTSYIPVYAETIQNMCDLSGRLSDMEVERLENILDKTSAESGFTVSVIINDNLEGKSAVEYAESFYNENFSKYPQSVILLINYDTNNDIIFTGENASQYFTESIKSKIISENVSPNIAEERISDAVTLFSEKITEFSQTIPAHTEPVRNEKDEKYEKENNIAFSIAFGIIAGIVCGMIVSVYIKALYKRSENDFAFSNHKCTHKIDFIVKEDKFRREFVNKSDSSS